MATQFNYLLRLNDQIADSSEQKETESPTTTRRTESDEFHYFISSIEFAQAYRNDYSHGCIESMQSCLNKHIEISTLLNYLIDFQSLDNRMDHWSNILLCIKWLVSYDEDINKHPSKFKTNHSNIYEIQGIEYRYTLLHVAAALSEVRLLKKVIEFAPKMDIDIPDHKGWTALHYASSRNHVRCAEILLEYGANLYAMDKSRHTPLHLCGRFKQYRCHHDGVMPLMGFWKDDIIRNQNMILKLVDAKIKCEDVSRVIMNFVVPEIPKFPKFFVRKNKTSKNIRKARKKLKSNDDDVIFRIYIG